MRLFAVVFVPPTGFQMYVKAPVPPLALTVALPLAAPQVAEVAVARAVIAGGSVMVTFAALMQPLASVTVTV